MITAEKKVLDTTTFILVILFIATSIFTIAGSQISLGFALVTWLASMALSRNWTVKRTGLELSLMAFILVCILASIFSVRPLESFVNLKNLFLIPILFVVGNTLRTEKRLIIALDVFVAFAAIFSVVGIVLFAIEATLKSMATQSTSMTWGAMSVFFVAMTSAGAFFGAGGVRRILYGLALIVQTASLMLSYVRGSYVGLVATLLVLAWLKSKRLVLIMLFTVVLLGLVMPASVKERALSIFDPNKPSTLVRLHQWRDSIDMFKDRPILGFGWVDLGEIHRSYAPPDADLTTDEYTIGHFHNNFIMVLMSFGSLGLAAFIWLIVRIIQVEYNAFRNAEKHKPILSAIVVGSLAGFAGFLFNGMFDWLFGDAEVVTMLWLSVGFVIAVSNIINQSASSYQI
jgi:putative inorganic carbon (HCO3(-)) transporter